MRFHVKSRNGCIQCKRRKIKVGNRTPICILSADGKQCNEQAPRCSNCVKRKVACQFETPGEESGTLNPRHDTSASSITRSSRKPPYPGGLRWKKVAGPAPNLPPNLKSYLGLPATENLKAFQCLNLIHHYTTTTSRTFEDRENLGPVWKVVVPLEAQSHPFLMHSILSISALHLSHLKSSNPGDRLMLLGTALSQQTMALKVFRATVPTLTPENSSAVLAFSHLIVFTVFGLSWASDTGDTSQDPLAELLAIFGLLRAAMAALRSAWKWLEVGQSHLLLDHGPLLNDRKYLSPDLKRSLQGLDHLIGDDPDGMNYPRSVCIDATELLLDSFVMAETRREDWCVILRFPMVVPNEFVDLLRVGDPTALVVLAHYCMILHRAPSRWWCVGCAANIVQRISEVLDIRYRPFIRFPLSYCTENGK